MPARVLIVDDLAFIKLIIKDTLEKTGFDVAGEASNGIEAVEQAVKAYNQYFNLAGQRVTQPTKGLYIVNGKKVIIK